MQTVENSNFRVEQAHLVSSTAITCFQETPRKTGDEKPVSRIGAFDLFNLFTANIIREKEVFTR